MDFVISLLMLALGVGRAQIVDACLLYMRIHCPNQASQVLNN